MHVKECPLHFSLATTYGESMPFNVEMHVRCQTPLPSCKDLLFVPTEVGTLTHWGRVTHICVSKLNTIDSDNGLSPGRRQAIIWTNVGISLIRPLGTNFSEMLIEIYTFSFKKIHFKMSSAKWRPFCPGLDVLTLIASIYHMTHVLGMHLMATADGR